MTDQATITTPSTTTIDAHLAAYGEREDATRRKLIEQSWAPSGTLADPPFDATGHDGLDAAFRAVQEQFPGHGFRRTSGIDEHHGVARYCWELVAEDGTVTVAGTDIARLGADGKLVEVTGFFGEPPALD